jgi:hypothetical protein
MFASCPECLRIRIHVHIACVNLLIRIPYLRSLIHSFIHFLYMHICDVHSDPFIFSFKVIRIGESLALLIFFADFPSGREKDRQCAYNVT